MKTLSNFFSFLKILWIILLGLWATNTLAEFNPSLTGTTNYIGRGYSKSDDGFAIQANLDYKHSAGFFLGTSISTVDFGDRNFEDSANVEITPYLGWSFNVSDDWVLDTQWSRYFYDGKIFGETADYNEFYLFLHFRDLITTRVSFSENYYAQGNFASDYELNGRYPITDSLEISSSVGYSQVEPVFGYDYLYWNSGITYFYKFSAFDFRYFDALEATHHNQFVTHNSWSYDPAILKATFVFSISVGFQL